MFGHLVNQVGGEQCCSTATTLYSQSSKGEQNCSRRELLSECKASISGTGLMVMRPNAILKENLGEGWCFG